MGCDGNPKETKKKTDLEIEQKLYISLSQVCRLVVDLRQLVAYNLHNNFFDSLHKVWNL
jgi:hypothetical protein